MSNWKERHSGQAKPSLGLGVPPAAGSPAVPLPRERSPLDPQGDLRSTFDPNSHMPRRLLEASSARAPIHLVLDTTRLNNRPDVERRIDHACSSGTGWAPEEKYCNHPHTKKGNMGPRTSRDFSHPSTIV